jgi:hypothetical protein
VGTVEAVGTVVQYSKRLLLQARWLGAAGGAKACCPAPYIPIPVKFSLPYPLGTRLQLLVGSPPGGLGGDVVRVGVGFCGGLIAVLHPLLHHLRRWGDL